MVQLSVDVDLSVISAKHHLGANFGIISRAVFSMLSMLPHRLIDRIVTPERSKIGKAFSILGRQFSVGGKFT